jgi:PBP1b-binding outer membrane lipoprotein LpoB
MKFYFKNLIACTTLALLFISCSSSEDATKTNVKYIVTSTANIITSVMYRGANGEMTEAVADEPAVEWTKSINVGDPFNAYLEVETINNESTAQEYDLAIYIDGELIDYFPAEVPSGESSSSTLEVDTN